MRQWLMAIASMSSPLRLVGLPLLAILLWLPLGIAIVLPLAIAWGIQANRTSIGFIATLYLALLAAMWLWGRWGLRQRSPLSELGWTFNGQRVRELAVGFALAIAGMGLLLGSQLALGWAAWRAPQVPWAAVLRDGLLVGAGIGFLEEVLFRGWFWTEFRRNYSRRWAGIHSSWLFALLHFLKPLDVILATWPQALGLYLLGQVMVQARFCGGVPDRGSLGIPVGFHGGLVCAIAAIHTSQAIVSTDRAPVWLTGIDGNPLAGLLGLILLSAFWLALRSQVRWRELLADNAISDKTD